MRNCIVIIPIYTLKLNKQEAASLENNICKLKKHPICFVAPEDLDLSEWQQKYPTCTIERFENKFFKNIDGYNKLLYSPDFYSRFNSYRYMLICQLDVYVFSDQLEEWCKKGFDYIGAPWLPQREPYYLSWQGQFYLSFKRWMLRKRKIYHNKSFYFQTGNGGFSLRRIEKFVEITQNLSKKIHNSKNKKGEFLYEDIFFSLVAPRLLEVKIPAYKEALGFSFEQNPELAFKLNNNKLPFGCHAWYKEPMVSYWKEIIPIP